MTDISLNNKRIARNTLILYVRMFVFMAIGLYTSRVILNTLGVEDYGVYNVVGGIVTMFTFINGGLASATSRNITFELGIRNTKRQRDVFGTSLTVHGIVSLIIIIASESIGLWLFYHKMQIPEVRLNAAMWVYQLSVLAAVLSIMMVPYNAAIIAHEKISAFAWITLMDSILKLVIVFLLVIIPYDKLIIYALLFFLVSIIDQLIYIFYCFCHFPEVRTGFIWNNSLIKEMSSFAGWSLFGNLAGVAYSQGVNILLNIFFGPVVNAARGIAIQVQGIVQQFIRNFQVALNPQITKTYAANNMVEMHKLMFRSARFSFLLMYFISLPVLLETNFILVLWLKTVPENTVLFFRIIMCTSLIYTIANPLIIANQATGVVKNYQIICGSILLTILPLSYITLKLGAPAYSVFIIHFVIEAITQFARMYMLRNLIDLPIYVYIKQIYLPLAKVISTSIILPIITHFVMEEGTVRFLIVGAVSVLSVGLASASLGLTSNERHFILENIRNKLSFKLQ